MRGGKDARTILDLRGGPFKQAEAIFRESAEYGPLTAALIDKLIDTAFSLRFLGGIYEEVKKALPFKEGPKEENISARSWFIFRILSEKVRAGIERLHESLAGGAGVWFYKVDVESKPVQNHESVKFFSGVIAGVARELVAVRDQNTKDLRAFFELHRADLEPGLTFENRLTSSNWLSLVSQSKFKEFGYALPANKDKMVLRSQSDYNTVLVMYSGLDTTGALRRTYLPIQLTTQDGQPKSEAAIQEEIVRLLTNQNSVGQPPEGAHPLFEIEFCMNGENKQAELEHKLDIVRTAVRAPVARVVLDAKRIPGTMRLSNVFAEFPHLTANENHGRIMLERILAKLTESTVATEIRPHRVLKPEVISTIKSGERITLAEIMAGFRLSSAESKLIHAASTKKMKTAPINIFSLASSLLCSATTYMCVNPAAEAEEVDTKAMARKQVDLQGELQIVPGYGGPNTEMIKIINTFGKLIDELNPAQTNFYELFSNQTSTELLSLLKNELETFATINNDGIERARRAKGLLAAIDTYVRKRVQDSLGTFFPSAQKLLAGGEAQVSSVKQKELNAITFVTAGSLDTPIVYGINTATGKRLSEGVEGFNLKEDSWQFLSVRRRFKAEKNKGLSVTECKTTTQTDLDAYRVKIIDAVFLIFLANETNPQKKIRILEEYQYTRSVIQSREFSVQGVRANLEGRIAQLLKTIV